MLYLNRSHVVGENIDQSHAPNAAITAQTTRPQKVFEADFVAGPDLGAGVYTQPQDSQVAGVPEKGRMALQLPQDRFTDTVA